jgi:hypothetical protein
VIADLAFKVAERAVVTATKVVAGVALVTLGASLWLLQRTGGKRGS